MSTGATVRTGNLDDPRVVALLAEHLGSMAHTAPAESRHALDPDGLRGPGIGVWTAWDGATVVGIAALKRLDDGHAEIKSMRTASSHLRRGIAAMLLRHLIAEAAARGYTRVSLETGSMDFFAPARRLYASFGFEPCAPFADYRLDPNSVFMTRRVDAPVDSLSGPPPRRVLVLGNSGAGKSTLALALTRRHGLPHLDLDTIVWEPGKVARMRAPDAILDALQAFIDGNGEWVIEGCYGDLVAAAAAHCTRLVFLNPGVDACLANNRRRPWEPHKYASPEVQNAMLENLQDWVRGYYARDDAWSYGAHRRVFDAFAGPKLEVTEGLDPAGIR